MAYTEEPPVSMDLKGDPYSTIVSGLDTLVMGGTMVKVIAWDDNEWRCSWPPTHAGEPTAP